MAIENIGNQIAHYCGLGGRAIDQARRRVVDGEQVPNAEKIYSIFEPHTGMNKRRPCQTPHATLTIFVLFLTAEQSSLDRVQHEIEILAHIFGEKAQHEIAVLLEQLVLTAISPVGIGTFQVLRAIQFDHDARISAQQVDFHSTPIVEWNWQFGIQAETPLRRRQRFQAAV
jgi:hypothetical protein